MALPGGLSDTAAPPGINLYVIFTELSGKMNLTGYGFITDLNTIQKLY